MKEILGVAILFGVIFGIIHLRDKLGERAERDRRRRLGDDS